MADKDWIVRIVNTEGRPCPLFHEPCPGTRRGCAFWIPEVIRNAVGDSDVVEGCLMAWSYVMHQESLLGSLALQANFDKAAASVRLGAEQISRTVAAAALVAGTREKILPSMEK